LVYMFKASAIGLVCLRAFVVYFISSGGLPASDTVKEALAAG